jgi:hypothetical protein
VEYFGTFDKVFGSLRSFHFGDTVEFSTWDIRSEESEMCATKIVNGQASDQYICREYLGNWTERCYLPLVPGRNQERKYNNMHSS